MSPRSQDTAAVAIAAAQTTAGDSAQISEPKKLAGGAMHDSWAVDATVDGQHPRARRPRQPCRPRRPREDPPRVRGAARRFRARRPLPGTDRRRRLRDGRRLPRHVARRRRHQPAQVNHGRPLRADSCRPSEAASRRPRDHPPNHAVGRPKCARNGWPCARRRPARLPPPCHRGAIPRLRPQPTPRNRVGVPLARPPDRAPRTHRTRSRASSTATSASATCSTTRTA